MSSDLRAPFPWFGGKSRAAHIVWEAFGDVPNYIEPFAGSLAVLLARPSPPRIETVNDLDCYLANFWRAVQHAPEDVASHADWPVNEADLHARHRWLSARAEFRERMKTDPEYFDAKVAGWWVWGLCQWIGSGWCTNPEWTGRTNAAAAPRGVHTARTSFAKAPALGQRGSGVHRKRPTLERGGKGVHRKRPTLERGGKGAAGRGTHASGRLEDLTGWMEGLSDRLRRVRVCCGNWTRLLGPAVTTSIGVTGVFLDPPYADTAGRSDNIYSCDSLTIAHDVREWALEHGGDPQLRIALCGYEGEHQMPDSWACVPWKANGGYAAARGNTENSTRERIWLSPHCLGAKQLGLFRSGQGGRR